MVPKSRRGGGERRTGRTAAATVPRARRAADAPALAVDTYWARSMRPLHVLVFLLPLILAYEVGSFLFLHDISGRDMSVSAYRLFIDFFRAFGVAGAFLPGVALIAAFLIWHIMVKDRWKVDPNTLGGMFLESIAWTLPLLVLAATMVHARRAMGTAMADAGTSIQDLSPMARLTIAVGAGLYEEMLFRLVALALLHFLLVDLIGLSSRWGYSLAVLISALAFAAYHRDQTNAMEFLFRTLAGVFFGTVYLMRGFGIVVATHAMYDILVLVVLRNL